ncbi:hypothetical protein V1507DRAFT_103052 [Lipomyces tetrasporus]
MLARETGERRGTSRGFGGSVNPTDQSFHPPVRLPTYYPIGRAVWSNTRHNRTHRKGIKLVPRLSGLAGLAACTSSGTLIVRGYTCFTRGCHAKNAYLPLLLHAILAVHASRFQTRYY